MVTGGFATGTAPAGGPLLPYEEDAARLAGVPATRSDLFAHSLTGEGLRRLWSLLDSGRYEVHVPEEAAPATVAWLVRAGDFDTAAELVAELRPFADRLRFTPRPADRPAPAVDRVHRRTAGEAGAALARRRPHPGAEAQREALSSGHLAEGAAVREPAHEALRRLGELAVCAFPGTVLPNPLVRELGELARQAELGAPFVEELAADIFTGTFSPKFLVAARIAADLLEGSLYARYYGIDYARVRRMAVAQAAEGAVRGQPARSAPEFAALCAERAGTGGGWSPAANGTVIEQAQILTTHNLATLAARAGIAPPPGWGRPARDSFETVCRLVARVEGNPRPLPTIKDAAYAWRQMLFHLSLCDAAERAAVLTWIEAEYVRRPAQVRDRLAPAFAGLRLAADGGSFGADGTADGGRARRLLGWSTDRHWMRDRG